MKKPTLLRIIGGAIFFFNIWLIGRYNIEGIPVLFLTIGFVVFYEYLVVRPIIKDTSNKE